MSISNLMETIDNRSYIIRSMELGDKIRQAREAKGWSQADLGQKVGVSQVSIQKIETGETRQSKHLPRILLSLGMPISDYDEAFPAAPEQPTVIQRDQIWDLETDRLPVHAAAEGGPGEVIITSDAVDFIPRPLHLRHVKDAYGLLIVGDSMWPEYRSGEMAIVEPSLPVIGGENYIFYAEKAGEARASIKHLRRATPVKWLVSQWNPSKDFALSRKEWGWAHRVSGKQSRR